MEEIKVGDYVRSNDGYIGKIINIREEDKRKCDTYYSCDNCMASGFYEHIKKHSKNIIDLIEVGDYVNGERILDITGDYIHTNETDHSKFYLRKHIKTILTKEQYMQNCYTVEGKE